MGILINKGLMALVSAIMGGILYRMGGSKDFDTKVRDIGIPVLATTLLLYLNDWTINWKIILAYLLHFGLLFASLTTYFKKEGTQAKWWNWLLVGLACSFSALPIALLTNHISGFIYRTIYLTIGILLWSELIGKDIWEEFGRGFLIIITIPFIV